MTQDVNAVGNLITYQILQNNVTKLIMIKKKLKILVYDIEISPSVGYYYSPMWQTNILETTRPWILISYSYKWLGDKKTKFVGLNSFDDFVGMEPDKEYQNDYNICSSLRDLLDEADIVIGHNSNGFDQKKSNLRFAYHGLEVPSAYEELDTKKMAKQMMKADSNSLNNLGKFFEIGVKDGGQGPIWKDCLRGDKKAWAKMKKYNDQDVKLTEALYLKLRPWTKRGVNMSKFNEDQDTLACTKCGSENVQKRGYISRGASKLWYQSYFCNDCRGWSKGKKGHHHNPARIYE